jgi:hypothetical protein
LVVKINETTGERSIYLGGYAEVAYTGAAAATPTPSATLSPTVFPMLGTFSAHAGTQPHQHADADQVANTHAGGFPHGHRHQDQHALAFAHADQNRQPNPLSYGRNMITVLIGHSLAPSDQRRILNRMQGERRVIVVLASSRGAYFLLL